MELGGIISSKCLLPSEIVTFIGRLDLKNVTVVNTRIIRSFNKSFTC